MDLRSITDRISVSPQIEAEDIAALKNEGVSLIIMNRPDGEEMGQPGTADLKAEAGAQGLSWIDIPVVSGQFTPIAIEEMASALASTDGKVHAFCRSGTRSCFLWAMAEALKGDMPLALVMDQAAKAGYDLSPAQMMLETLRASHD